MSNRTTPARFLLPALTLSVLLTVSVLPVAAQLPPNQSAVIPVAVTDPLNRFVTGLELENFTVLENGVPRPITNFFDLDSPISIAIVSELPLPAAAKLSGPDDDLIQTGSLSDGLRQLAASKNLRKTIILLTAWDTRIIPGGIQVIQADPGKLLEAVIEVRNQYLLQFQPSVPAARLEVIVNKPRGLPVLKPVWKRLF
jgi:hypothetical protein